uniref:EF-hand domain-containing protein n=1 Tax=Timema cristinae TaxID=61476 RepID=A0A7R9HEC2_TIMCR|nr:unnamed protein product [Timema cristinae]
MLKISLITIQLKEDVLSKVGQMFMVVFQTAAMTRVNAESYLKSKKVHELFVFLASHLVVADQDDPIDYLIDLLDQCMLFRADLRNPPLLFSPEHLEAVFRAFDPAGTGVISRDQYEQATFSRPDRDTNPYRPIIGKYSLLPYVATEFGVCVCNIKLKSECLIEGRHIRQGVREKGPGRRGIKLMDDLEQRNKMKFQDIKRKLQIRQDGGFDLDKATDLSKDRTPNSMTTLGIVEQTAEGCDVIPVFPPGMTTLGISEQTAEGCDTCFPARYDHARYIRAPAGPGGGLAKAV